MLLTNLYRVVKNIACRLSWPVSLFAKWSRRAGIPFDVLSSVCSAVLRPLSYLCKHQISNIPNCCLLSSANFLQSAKAFCTQTIEKQLPPLFHPENHTKEKGPNTLCSRVRMHTCPPPHTHTNTQTSEIKQKEALHSIIWQGCYLVTDTVQYLQILTLITCDQENGLAPSLPVIRFFFFPSLQPRATLAQPWFTSMLSLLGAPWSEDQSRPQQSTVAGGDTTKPPGHTLYPGTSKNIPQATFPKHQKKLSSQLFGFSWFGF